MSLRSRLLAGMAFVAVVLIAVSVLITATTRDELIGQIDDRLAAFSVRVGDGLPPPFVGDDSPGIPPAPDGVPERVSDAYQGFVDADGVLTTRFAPNVGDYGAPDVDADDLPATGERFFTVGSLGEDGASTDRSYRVIARRFGDTVAITALPIDDVEATIRQLVVVELLGALLILAALGLVCWWVVHLGIRPIKEMTRTASQIADGDLAVRVPEGASGTESGDLAVALNRMLGQIEGALAEQQGSEDRLRRFVADAAHELRTPVTTIRGYAELYRRGGLDERAALDDAMTRTEQEAARMGRLVEDMLVLARLDEQRPLEMLPVDLAVLASDAGRDARAAWPDRTIDIDGDDEPALIAGDEDRLRQVIANVVGNALVHTDPDVPVAIAVSSTAGRVSVEVRDAGGGMSSEVTTRVTERFYRADPARSRHRGGSGLGLSIVDAAVSAHGGSVTIDSRPGAGTDVRLDFPRIERSIHTGSDAATDTDADVDRSTAGNS